MKILWQIRHFWMTPAGEFSGRGFRGQNPYPFWAFFFNLLVFFKKKNPIPPSPKFSLSYKNISKPLPLKSSGYAPPLQLVIIWKLLKISSHRRSSGFLRFILKNPSKLKNLSLDSSTWLLVCKLISALLWVYVEYLLSR